MSMNDQNLSQKHFKDSLFERIESENVCPHSRLFYRGRELLVWCLWLVSVMVGALAVAVSLFVVIHGQYALYEATHANFLIFLVEALPYLWMGTFVIMVYAAIYNVRHTKKGYRHPLWLIMGSSILLSLFGGMLLQLLGLGYEIDEMLGQHMMLYTSQQKFEQRLWQDPDDGRLLGMQVHSTLSPTSTIIFEDITGKRWTMNTSELPQLDKEMLATNMTVRLLGKPVDEELHIFHACGVFPWVHERDLSVEELSRQRDVFLERISRHAHKETEGKLRLHGQNLASTTLVEEAVCATIPAVRRISLPPRDE